MDTILKYFPRLSQKQKDQFQLMLEIYPEWNDKINVISRKDIDNLETNHILHSLAISKFIDFTPGTTVMDLGTGGGFPAIPLAVLFPEVRFHLVDRIAKKLRVAADVAEKLGLENVTFQHGDVGECHEKFDFVISRAAMDHQEIIRRTRRNIKSGGHNGLPNGWIVLKGGDLNAELGEYAKISEITDLSTKFDEPFFSTKKIVFTPF